MLFCFCFSLIFIIPPRIMYFQFPLLTNIKKQKGFAQEGKPLSFCLFVCFTGLLHLGKAETTATVVLAVDIVFVAQLYANIVSVAFFEVVWQPFCASRCEPFSYFI